MTKKHPRSWALRVLVASLALAGVTGGCSIAPPVGQSLRLRSLENERVLEQRFGGTYVEATPSGSYHVVLVNDGVQRALRRAKPGEPLEPVELLPVQQIVHIHVFWRPMRGAKPDNPSATNAAIDWYFIGNNDQGPTDVLHYQGAGFVTVRGASIGEDATVEVRSATLRPAGASAGMQDPFGAVRVAGLFRAEPDASRVRETLTRIESLERMIPTTQATAEEAAR